MSCKPIRKPSALLSLMLLALLDADAGRAVADETRATELYRRLLRSAAYVSTPGVGKGTGWVADRQRRLLVTNQHVVENKEAVLVLFPAYRDGEVIAERSYYKDRRPVRGRVVCTSAEQDLAVVELESLPADIEELPLAGRSPSPGEPVFSVGNPGASGALWVFTAGRVRAVYRKRFATPVGKAVIWRHARVVETSSPTNAGDSGGPVVNEHGQLVAVTEGGNRTAQLVTTFIDVSEVRQLLDEARRIMSPHGADDYLLRGRRFERMGRWNNAITAYTEVIRRNAQEAPDVDRDEEVKAEAKTYRNPRQTAAAYNNRGNCFYARKDYDTAIADYDEALRLDPRLAFAYHNRGNCWRCKQAYDRAMADFTRAIRLKPDYAGAFLGRGLCYQGQGRYERAIADYDRAIELWVENPGPDTVWAYNNRGYCRLELGQYEAALADLTEALRLDPYQAKVWGNLGETHYRNKDYQKAGEAALRAVELDPNDCYPWNTLGAVFHARKDYRRAAAAYSQAIRCNPRNAYSYYWRAQAYRGLGDEERAESDLAQAARLNPKYAQD